MRLCRLCMNNPPTALVVFGRVTFEVFGRSSMNDPPTALVEFAHFLPCVLALVLLHRGDREIDQMTDTIDSVNSYADLLAEPKLTACTLTYKPVPAFLIVVNIIDKG